MRPSKPIFQSVVDLGLRDVGVRTDRRRLAAHFGKASVWILPMAVLSAFALCILVSGAGADTWIVVAFGVAWTAAVILLSLRTITRSPIVVVKVTAEGTNQATWVFVAWFLLLAIAGVLARDAVLLPVVVFAVVMSLIVFRGRGRLPEVLRELRPLLAADESVLGDGIGLSRGARGRRDAFRLVVATDRRVLATASTRSKEPFPLLDVPYGRVSRFGIEWKGRGRVGVLSLIVAGVDGAPSETHVVSAITPANLLSIAQALHLHGVPADDPEAVSEAERGWEEALRRNESQKGLFDRAAMSTREFDRALWLLLGLCAVTLYVIPYAVGPEATRDAALPVLLLVVPALCAICAYVSGTKSSLAYIVPLNLLVSPTFFFADASDVVGLMLAMSVVAAIGLWAGSALRGPAADLTAGPRRRAARGSLRYAISGLSLVRLSGMLLAVVVALVAVATAAGFELTSLRLAVDEATVKQVPVDGRSNLAGNAASLTYTSGPDLRELITDEHWDAAPNDGARWELRSSFSKGYNVVSLAHYVFESRLDDAAAVADFVADKDREHSRVAGSRVTHTERVVDGRKGYVWRHRSRHGYWQYTAWFPQPVRAGRMRRKKAGGPLQEPLRRGDRIAAVPLA